MKLLETIKADSRANPCRVAFPSPTNLKLLMAMNEVSKAGYCTIVVIGDAFKIKLLCEQNRVDDSKWKYVDFKNQEYQEKILKKYLQLPDLVYGEKSLKKKMNDPLYLALMMEAVGEVDVTFAGMTKERDLILAAQTIIGLENNLSVVSSLCIAELPNYTFEDGGNMIAIGDCAICPNPSASELASIAISACETLKSITDWEPRCALLSYSTDNSKDGNLVDKVRTAVKLTKERRPDLKIDGEFQLDSAIVKEVAVKKVKRPSEVAGQANIIIFPDLNAADIGIKLIQHFGRANTYGPLLQGFKKICSNCRESAPVSEIVGNIIFSIARAKTK